MPVRSKRSHASGTSLRSQPFARLIERIKNPGDKSDLLAQ